VTATHSAAHAGLDHSYPRPVKNLKQAKQSCRVLDQPARTQLAQAMLHDFWKPWARGETPEVAIVTCDPFALALANHMALSDCDHTNTVKRMPSQSRHRSARWASTTPVIRQTFRCFSLESKDARSRSREGSVLCRQRRPRYKRAFRRPPVYFPPFGNDSFKPHLAAAKATASRAFFHYPASL